MADEKRRKTSFFIGSETAVLGANWALASGLLVAGIMGPKSDHCCRTSWWAELRPLELRLPASATPDNGVTEQPIDLEGRKFY